MKQVKINNLEKIKEWIKSNPDGTKKECAIALNLSYKTVIDLSKEL